MRLAPSIESGNCSLFDQVADVSPAMGEFFVVGRMVSVRKSDKSREALRGEQSAGLP